MASLAADKCDGAQAVIPHDSADRVGAQVVNLLGGADRSVAPMLFVSVSKDALANQDPATGSR